MATPSPNHPWKRSYKCFATSPGALKRALRALRESRKGRPGLPPPRSKYLPIPDAYRKPT